MSPKVHVEEEEQSGFDPEERGQGPGSFDGQRMQDSGSGQTEAQEAVSGCLFCWIRGSRSRRCLDSVTDLGLWEQREFCLESEFQKSRV